MDRLRWWTINSPSWSDHIDADRNRGVLLTKLARWATGLLGSSRENPTIVDVGCGEGAFLRTLKQLMPKAALLGIDFCPTMLNEARRRSTDQEITYSLGDIEEQISVPRSKADLVTSILAMDEMDQLGSAFANIAEILKPGGIAMIAVMDPLKELERNSRELKAFLDNGAQLDNPVLLVKTFPKENMEPAAPYSRIVRPIAKYCDTAAAGTLHPEPVEQWAHPVGIGQHTETLLFDILTFRKP